MIASSQQFSEEHVVKQIREAAAIVIFRGSFTQERLIDAARVLSEEGLGVMEIAMNSPGALSLLSALQSELGSSITVGAGTCRTADSVRSALTAGAAFTVAPNLDAKSVAVAKAADRLHLPGVFTGTEIAQAVAEGSQMVKVFPCGDNGAQMLRALRAPFGEVEMVAVGGVGIANSGEYLSAGAVAVGVGSAITQAITNLDTFRRQVASLRSTLNAARGPSHESQRPGF